MSLYVENWNLIQFPLHESVFRQMCSSSLRQDDAGLISSEHSTSRAFKSYMLNKIIITNNIH